jgi:mannosyltransferase
MQPHAVNDSASVSSSHSHSAGWPHWAILLLLLGIAIAVRVHCLGCKPFWFDECFSVEVSRMDWHNFVRVLWWREANMSLYYSLLRIWLHFGSTEFFVRSLSVLFAAISIPVIYWLARLMFDQKVAIVATALLALNDFHLRYSQEARSYALFFLLATLSSGFLILFLRQPRRSWRNAYTLASILAVYAHLYALLLLLAHWLVLRRAGIPVDDQSRQSVASDLRRAWITIGIAVFPLIVFVAKTGAGPIRWIRRPGITDVWDFWRYFAGGVPLLAAAALAIIIVRMRRRLWAKDQNWEIWRLQFLGVWLLFPIFITLLMSLAKPVFYPRYMIFCLPPLLILFAFALASLPSRWIAATAVCAVLVLSARAIPFVYAHDFEDERDGAGDATNFILDHSETGDGIIFHIPQARVPYQFFCSLRAGRSVGSEGFGPEILYPRHGAHLEYLDLKSKLSPDLLRSIIAGRPRIWVVLMYNGPKLPDPTAVLIQQTLPQSYPRVEKWEFPKVEILLYGGDSSTRKLKSLSGRGT